MVVIFCKVRQEITNSTDHNFIQKKQIRASLPLDYFLIREKKNRNCVFIFFKNKVINPVQFSERRIAIAEPD